MARAKQASKRTRRRNALPVLGAAGASLAMAGAASASAVPPANVPSQASAGHPFIYLDEEEISDVSLGTFYVLDQEDAKYLGTQIARRCGGCGGCRGCRGCAAVARCGGGCAVARCAVRRCAGCAVVRRCGVGVVGCAGCGCVCSGCSAPCWTWSFNGWVWVC
jgi:hypothetical protein